MKINYNILGKAVVDTLKPVVTVVAIVAVIFLVGFICLYVAGKYAPLAFFGSGVLILVSVVVAARYEELMNKYKQDQRDMMDILKR